MLLQILSSSIFLPLVVASMIIAQIYLENYQNDDKKIHHKKYLSNFYIVFIYLAQEICIMELTLLNINIIAFTVVIPITLILRNKNKIWWGLFAITPYYCCDHEYLLKTISIRYLGYEFITVSLNCNYLFCPLFYAIKNLLTAYHTDKSSTGKIIEP